MDGITYAKKGCSWKLALESTGASSLSALSLLCFRLRRAAAVFALQGCQLGQLHFCFSSEQLDPEILEEQ